MTPSEMHRWLKKMGCLSSLPFLYQWSSSEHPQWRHTTFLSFTFYYSVSFRSHLVFYSLSRCKKFQEDSNLSHLRSSAGTSLYFLVSETRESRQKGDPSFPAHFRRLLSRRCLYQAYKARDNGEWRDGGAFYNTSPESNTIAEESRRRRGISAPPPPYFSSNYHQALSSLPILYRRSEYRHSERI